jgi:hypothetical protein
MPFLILLKAPPLRHFVTGCFGRLLGANGGLRAQSGTLGIEITSENGFVTN